jgi:hypothetical protein
MPTSLAGAPRAARRIAAALLAAGTFAAVTAAPATAATLGCATAGNGNSGASFTLGHAVAVTCVSGKNDTNTIGAEYALFGHTGWKLAQKTDGHDGDGKVVFTIAPENDTKSGTWKIGDYTGLEKAMITLKAGNGFAAFLLDVKDLAGTWTSSKGLSHASVYYKGNPAPIPLPAAAWLLIGGMGALAATARRRKAATA